MTQLDDKPRPTPDSGAIARPSFEASVSALARMMDLLSTQLITRSEEQVEGVTKFLHPRCAWWSAGAIDAACANILAAHKWFPTPAEIIEAVDREQARRNPPPPRAYQSDVFTMPPRELSEAERTARKAIAAQAVRKVEDLADEKRPASAWRPAKPAPVRAVPRPVSGPHADMVNNAMVDAFLRLRDKAQADPERYQSLYEAAARQLRQCEIPGGYRANTSGVRS